MNSVEQVAWSDLLKNFFATRPKDVDGVANQSSMYYREWCLKKLFGVFEISGAPDFWDIDYMYEHIFLDGHICVTDTDIGVVPLQCGLTGINVFNHPTTCIISNPVLGSLQRIIGADCEVVKLQYNYKGVSQMIQRYATLLALCDSSISVNLVNTKVTSIFGVANKAQSESVKKMYDDVNQGKPIVVINDDLAKKLNDNIVNLRVKESYLADQIEVLKQNLMNDFLSEIGIRNANTEKKERLISSEVNSNNQEVKSSAQHWLDNIQSGFDKVNNMFSLNLRIRLRTFDEGGEKNGDSSELNRVRPDDT